MLIVKPDSLPRFWWLFPWTVCRQLHKNAVALRELADRQDDLLKDKAGPRPRWSIWISGVAGPDRKYLFVDNDGKCENGLKGIKYGTPVHFYDGGFTSFKDAEAAIVFCDRLNRQEVQS
jgi:hypothetical protein